MFLMMGLAATAGLIAFFLKETAPAKVGPGALGARPADLAKEAA